MSIALKFTEIKWFHELSEIVTVYLDWLYVLFLLLHIILNKLKVLNPDSYTKILKNLHKTFPIT